LLELERVRNAIARDLHDDIGSTISSINILSNVAIRQTAEDPNVRNQLKKIANQSASIMERMSDIVWSINPVNDSLSAVSARMKEFTAEILEPMNIQYIFNGIDEVADTTLSVEAKRNIYLTYKEILNNAAKYSGATLVTVNIGINQETLVLNVSDNGCGFDPEQVKRGNGLKNITERSSAMNASCKITSSPGNGTKVDVVIPLT
jgi:signal transduction histidine kinase